VDRQGFCKAGHEDGMNPDYFPKCGKDPAKNAGKQILIKW
jgi:hypothetical protein